MIKYSIISKNEQNILYEYYVNEKCFNTRNPEGIVFTIYIRFYIYFYKILLEYF